MAYAFASSWVGTQVPQVAGGCQDGVVTPSAGHGGSWEEGVSHPPDPLASLSACCGHVQG